MKLKDALRGSDGKPSLYRRAWKETSDPLVAEARAQTLALQKLQLWLRLVYSVLALAVLMGWWGFAEGGSRAVGIAGAVVGSLALVCVIVLRTGIANGRRNVEAILEALQTSSQPSKAKTSTTN